MRIGLGLGIAAIALLAGCGQAGQSPENRSVFAPSPTPVEAPTASATKSPLREWLVGTWSFEPSCQTDFIVHYNADGSLDNSGHIGTWAVEGERVTETITERLDDNGEGSVKVDPPETNIYMVMRDEPNRGVIRFQGRSVPIRRC
jgi:hypothetical protein